MSRPTRTLVIVLSLIVLAGVVGAAWWVTRSSGAGHSQEDGEAAPTRFICPMHPQIVSDRPGSCPICGMDLVPATGGEDEIEPPPERPEGPADRATVRVPDAKLRRIGARSEPAAKVRFEREVRAAGSVTVDETHLRQVHTKTAGWVERLWANAEGESVRRGQPLLEIYSPELLAAQEEYLVALRARDRLRESAMAEVAGSGAALLESARSRLRLLDLTDDQIRILEETGHGSRTVVVSAPISGTILKRGIAQGARVEPGTMLLEVADLSKVWVLADVFEYELPFVREGQAALMTLAYVPGREFRGTVTKVYPTLDPTTRTAKVRTEFPNADGALKPDMYAEVRLVSDLGERLAVPGEAVMETGTRDIVFVDEGDGVFTPREVEIGLRLPDKVEILAGLEEGERVLATGNFFVDSESKLRAALEGAARTGSAPPPAGHQH